MRHSEPSWYDRLFRAPHDRIFISYRREDGDLTWWLASSLRKAFHDERVFMDTRDIEPSRDFAAETDAQLRSCSVIVAVIGPAWKRRIADLHKPDDWVRRELAIALSSGAVVIPVLIDVDASELTGLPPEIRGLLDHQAVRFSSAASAGGSEGYAERDVNLDRLLRSIRKSRFRRAEIRAAFSIAGLLLLTTQLLILALWVFVAPLSITTYLGDEMAMFRLAIALTIVVLVCVGLGVYFAPHSCWSSFANLARRSWAITGLITTSAVLCTGLYLLRPLAVWSADSLPAQEGQCSKEYQAKRFDDDRRDPCDEQLFRDKFTLISMRTGWSFSSLAKAQIDISVEHGGIKAIRAPLAVTFPPSARSKGVLNLPFELKQIQDVTTPFVIWVATEPAGSQVTAKLIVRE